MSGNNGGPWGGGGNRGGGNRGSGGNGSGGGGRGPGDQQPIPEIDEIVKKGQEQLRVLMGGGGGKNGGSGGSGGPGFSKRGVTLGLLGLVALWLFASFYTVRPEERSVELMFGQFYRDRKSTRLNSSHSV